MFSLMHNIALYVPATVNVSEGIDNTSLVRNLAQMLSSEFGGCHLESSNSIGFYVAADGSLVSENTKVLRAFCDNAETAKAFVFSLASDLCVEMVQESVLVTVDGIAYFVTAD